MKSFSPVFQKQFKNQVEYILHAPTGFHGKILEMTVVVDCALDKTEVTETLPGLLKIMKGQSEVFRNVRMNLTFWHGENRIENGVKPMMLAMSESCYTDYVPDKGKKELEILTAYLKKFHARSKLILFLTDGNYKIKDKEAFTASLQPFLKGKMLEICCGKEEPVIQKCGKEKELR